MRVLIAAGGTAGHINPALAIAGAIKKADPTAEIHFAGRKAGMETWLVEEAAKARVGVYGISGFLIAPLTDQKEKCFSTVVLGYARLNEDQIREGIRRLAAAWKCSSPCP